MVLSNWKRYPLVLERTVLLFVLVFLTLTLPLHASQQEARKILSLVDYIGSDYRNAVREGKVVSEEEYREMLEFSSELIDLFKEFSGSQGKATGIESDLVELNEKIKQKASSSEVEFIADRIKGKIISTYNVETYPQGYPSFQRGKVLYEEKCSSCHGMVGAGDGPLSSNLNPPPTDFTDKGVINQLSPFKVFNTLSFGIRGTAMPSFPELSEEEKWDIAFYVLSLGFEKKEGEEGKKVFEAANIPPHVASPRFLSGISNKALSDKLKVYTDDRVALEKVIAFLRKEAFESGELGEDPLVIASSILKESIDIYRSGKTQEAYKRSIDAYLEGFEKVEPKLALKDRKLTYEIETKLAELRNAMKSGEPVDRVESLYKGIQNDFNRASIILQNGKPVGKALSFINSFSIIVREGLEAVLIVAAVIAFLRKTGATGAIRYVHMGWAFALIMGLITWVVANTVISVSGVEREILEGVTSLIAAVVLFYVSYWLITKIEVKKWKDYIQGKVREAISKKSVFALAGVSFFAVYREVFETVLFYQALWLQTEVSKTSIIWGLVAGIALLLSLVVFIFKLGLRIPIKHFFSITSFMLYFLSFILVGKGIRELQEGGIIGITVVNFVPQIDILGVYPTLETLVPQGILILAFIGALLWLGVINQERRKKEIAVSVARIADDMKSMHEAFEHIKGHIIEWKRCQDINLEAEELDNQIQDVIRRVDELESKLEDFFDLILKNRESGEGEKPKANLGKVS